MNYMYDSQHNNGYDYNNQYPQYNAYAPWQNTKGYMNKCAGVKVPSMTLEGTGIVKAKPDIAVVVLGVMTEGTELRAVQQENAEKVQSVIDSLIRIGVERRDIETESYSIVPQYDFIEGRQEFKGYRVTNTLKITLSNTEEVGKVIDTAVANGANVVNRVDFKLSDPSSTYKIALSKAIMDAVNKAVSIERTLKIIVDKTPISITEESSDVGIFQERSQLMATAATTPIISGEIEVVAKIKAVFNYRKV